MLHVTCASCPSQGGLRPTRSALNHCGLEGPSLFLAGCGRLTTRLTTAADDGGCLQIYTPGVLSAYRSVRENMCAHMHIQRACVEVGRRRCARAGTAFQVWTCCLDGHAQGDPSTVRRVKFQSGVPYALMCYSHYHSSGLHSWTSVDQCSPPKYPNILPRRAQVF